MLSDVILITRGSKGDLYPFLQIGSVFKNKGHRVTLLTDHVYEKYASKHGFDFAALDDEESKCLNAMPEFYGDLPSLLKLYEGHIIPNLKREVNMIEDAISEEGKPIVIAHGNYYLSALMAMEKTGFPLYLCVLSPSFIHSSLLFEGIAKSLSAELNEIRDAIGLESISDWKQWLGSYTRRLAFWPEWFSDDSCRSFADLEHIGFLPAFDSEGDLKENTGNAASPGMRRYVLLTHGTSLPFDERYFRFGIEACEELRMPLLVTTSFRHLLPDNLPDHVIWAEFLPFDELMPSIDLAVHHGGVGTVQESILHAVPQLIIGQGFDRQHNGRIVSRLGLGDWIPPKLLSKEVLLKKIKSILSDGAKRSTCARYASLLKGQTTFDNLYASVNAEESGLIAIEQT